MKKVSGYRQEGKKGWHGDGGEGGVGRAQGKKCVGHWINTCTMHTKRRMEKAQGTGLDWPGGPGGEGGGGGTQWPSLNRPQHTEHTREEGYTRHAESPLLRG